MTIDLDIETILWIILGLNIFAVLFILLRTATTKEADWACCQELPHSPAAYFGGEQ